MNGRKQLWGGKLKRDSYFVPTMGRKVTEDGIEKYILFRKVTKMDDQLDFFQRVQSTRAAFFTPPN